MSDVGLDFDVLNPTQQDEVRQACQSQACVDAAAAVVTARNDFIVKCEEVTRLVRRRDDLLITAAIMAVIAVAVMIIGVVLAASPEPITSLFGSVMLAVGLVVLFIAGLVALAARSYSTPIDRAREALEVSRDEFIRAVANVQAACPVQCQPNLEMPSCT